MQTCLASKNENIRVLQLARPLKKELSSKNKDELHAERGKYVENKGVEA
jgi:hypothetical protein